MLIFLGTPRFSLPFSSSLTRDCRHIHWYERLWPLTSNGTIDSSSIVNNNTYMTNPGKSLTHIINGMAGNIESHSTLDAGESTLPITAVLDFEHYGFSKLRFINESALAFSFIMGGDGSIGDELLLLKRGSSCPASNSTSSSSSVSGKPTSSVPVGGYNATSTSATTTASGTGVGYSSSTSVVVYPTSTTASESGSVSFTGTSTSVIVYPTSTASESITYTTEVVTSYTTYCPASTTFVQGSSTYTVSTVSSLAPHTTPTSLFSSFLSSFSKTG